ncbi:MAG: right-handed parallel beta-helix repeat-containing protein [Thermoplasmatales archaeon]|nr:right-handed parallel beta-helix repeat-containing protein [Thermoplasmatales archaeon]
MKYTIPIMVILLFVSTSFVVVSYNVDKSSTLSFDGNTLYVGGSGPNNYTRIQDAIDYASDWDTVFVYTGSYYENVLVNKSISLIGEDRNLTFIDGSGSGDVVFVSADYITISGFMIQNGGLEFPNGGIHTRSNYSTISGNNIENNFYGIVMFFSDNIDIIGNTITDNNQCGIYLEGSSNNNILGNFINSQPFNGVGLWNSSNNNIIYENTIINNKYSGIRMLETFSNIITKNMISKNLVGVRIEYSSNATISSNNFIKNRFREALFVGKVFLQNKNIWDENYWNRPRVLPKPIFGIKGKLFVLLPWINFDWHPAQEPYDISFERI